MKPDKFAPENPAKDEAVIEAHRLAVKAGQAGDEKRAKDLLGIMGIKEIPGISGKDLRARNAEVKKAAQKLSWKDLIERNREMLAEEEKKEAEKDQWTEEEEDRHDRLEDLMEAAVNSNVKSIYEDLIERGLVSIQVVIDAVERDLLGRDYARRILEVSGSGMDLRIVREIIRADDRHERHKQWGKEEL